MIAKISDSATEISNDAEILQLPGRQVLEIRVVRELSQRSDASRRSGGHRAGNPAKNPADERFIAAQIRQLLDEPRP